MAIQRRIGRDAGYLSKTNISGGISKLGCVESPDIQAQRVRTIFSIGQGDTLPESRGRSKAATSQTRSPYSNFAYGVISDSWPGASQKGTNQSASMCLRLGISRVCVDEQVPVNTTTKECPFSVDKVTAMLLVLWPFLYRSHPSCLPSLPSFRLSFVFRPSAL